MSERTSTESDPHSYYCAACRSTYGFPWGRAPDCTCAPVQEFVVAHRESHDADTKRLQINTSVNKETSPIEPTCKESDKDLTETLRFRIFHLLLDNWPTPMLSSDRQVQQIVVLSNKLIDLMKTHDTPSFDNGRGDE